MFESDSVAIVLDRAFAGGLDALKRSHVWVVRSEANMVSVDRLRATERSLSLTDFQDYGEPLSEALNEILSTVELHHGPLGQSPPFLNLDVFGTSADAEAKESLARIGFALVSQTPTGFTARRLTP
jgi:hypothetical protein